MVILKEWAVNSKLREEGGHGGLLILTVPRDFTTATSNEKEGNGSTTYLQQRQGGDTSLDWNEWLTDDWG